MRTIEQIQAHKIQIKARRDFKARNKKKSTKKAKDRTKIQGGALLIVCGLFEFFKIKVGEDLEKYCLLKYSGIIGHLTRGYLAALNDTKCEKFETF